jgi:hypothetical protein
MKKIYIVTSGTYSDYGINAIFDTKELAKKYISAFDQKYMEMNIEEWNLNEFDFRPGYKAYRVRMNKKGNTKEIEWLYYHSQFSEDDNGISFTYDNGLMNCTVFAKDEKHAVKIANEKRIQYLATNKWGEK